MKKSIIARVGIMAMALTLATTSLMSGTLARYTTQASGTATAIVAKWGTAAMTVGGDSIMGEGTHTVKLAGGATIDGETDKAEARALFAHTGEQSGSTDTREWYIGPGMSGSTPIIVDMTGSQIASIIEIKLRYTEDTTASMANRVNYKLGGKSSNATLTEKDFTMVRKTETAENWSTFWLALPSTQVGGTDSQKAALTLEWEWPIGSTAVTDNDDNAFMSSLGSNTANIKVEIQITAYQASADDTGTIYTPNAMTGTNINTGELYASDGVTELKNTPASAG